MSRGATRAQRPASSTPPARLSNAVGAAALGTLFFEVAARQTGTMPTDLLGPAYVAVLVVVAVLSLVTAVATRIIPADAHVGADPTQVH